MRWRAQSSGRSVVQLVFAVSGSGGSPLPTLLGLPRMLVMVDLKENDVVLVPCRKGVESN